MERETKVITTPAGTQIEVKTYLTGREKRALTNVYIQEGLSIDPSTSALKGMSAALLDKAQELAWKTIIVSVDGKKEPEISFADLILDSRSSEYDFIVKAVNDIVGSSEEKKTS